MKITIITRKLYKGGWPIDVSSDIECKGSGTETNPAIIETSENLPKAFKLEKSNLFITIQNCYLDSLIVDWCRNLRIENCNIRSVSLQFSSKVFVNKSTIRWTLVFYDSNNITVDNCTIKKLKIHVSNSNIIKNSSIKVIKYITGNGNILEANRIPEKQLNKIKKKYWYSWYNLKIT